ncbi:LysR substrate-binding domain-containing protein, partial [Roseateles sp. GG27B]
MATKLEALLRGLGCGALPVAMVRRHIDAGRLVSKVIEQGPRIIALHYAWRNNAATGGQPPGRALAWWLQQLQSTV